ncbi:MAG: hypothetical protein QF893_03965 [Alphaproteobacteria bacterium]|jgi:hypothetical protein|nr:hypothetical protein [Alphaproteobacteria bacterium]
MFRRFFGGSNGDETPPAPEHAWDLRPGDFLKFGLVAPDGLGRAELQVAGVHAVDLGGPGKIRRVLELNAPALDGLRLWRGEDETVAVAHEVDRPVVEKLFDLDVFALLFDPDEPAAIVLERLEEPGDLGGWTSGLYRQEGAQQAYHHREDPATDLIGGQLTGAGEEFDHYRLVSDDRRHAIEVAVYDGGRTEVSLIALLPEALIEELWSG